MFVIIHVHVHTLLACVLVTGWMTMPVFMLTTFLVNLADVLGNV